MITRLQIRLALTALDMNRTKAADALGIGRSTLQRVSSDDDGFANASPLTLRRIKEGFERLGVTFTEAGGVIPPKTEENPPT